MRVQKRDGSMQSVDVNKIVKAVERCSFELPGVELGPQLLAGLFTLFGGRYFLGVEVAGVGQAPGRGPPQVAFFDVEHVRGPPL